MSNLLILKSSILGQFSASNQLVDEAVGELRDAAVDATIVERDLANDPVPHLGADAGIALRTGASENAEQTSARLLSDGLIGEIMTADTIIIGAPMYNFGMPSTLKAWFDYVLRAGVTFKYSENGPEGMVKGKRAIVVLSRGGVYSEGPAAVMDSQEPHIRNLLGFIGIVDVQFVYAEGLAMGPEARERGMQSARINLRAALDASGSIAFRASI